MAAFLDSFEYVILFPFVANRNGSHKIQDIPDGYKTNRCQKSIMDFIPANMHNQLTTK